MKFSIARDEFAKQWSLVKPNLAKKVIAEFQHFAKISASGKRKVVITIASIDTSTRATSVEADVAEAGEVVISGSFLDGVLKVTTGDDLTFTLKKDKRVEISDGDGVFNVSPLNPEEWAEPKWVSRGDKPSTQHGTTLVKALKRASESASDDHARPTLTAVLVKPNNEGEGSLEVVGTDSYCLSKTDFTELPEIVKMLPENGWLLPPPVVKLIISAVNTLSSDDDEDAGDDSDDDADDDIDADDDDDNENETGKASKTPPPTGSCEVIFVIPEGKEDTARKEGDMLPAKQAFRIGVRVKADNQPEMEIAASLIGDTYPKYDTLIPPAEAPQDAPRVSVSCEELAQAAKRIMVVTASAERADNTITLKAVNSELRCSASVKDINSDGATSVPIRETFGNRFAISINAVLLRQMLGQFDTEEVTLRLNETEATTKPILITADKQPEVVTLVMPVRNPELEKQEAAAKAETATAASSE